MCLNQLTPGGQKPGLYSQTSKNNTMKSFLIMVAAVVIGVIVAGFVKTKLLKQAA